MDANRYGTFQRTLLVALALGVLSSETAFAAGRDWSGFYLGANFGYGQSRTQADFALPAVPVFSTNDAQPGAVFGAQAGYNVQFGRFVFGVEGDAAATTQKSDKTHVCLAPLCAAGNIAFQNEQKVTWIGTLRGRVGIAFDRWLVYATGGAGAGGFKSQHSVSTTLTSVTDVKTNSKLAWVVGGGVEFALDPRWSVKLEYLYLQTPEIRSTYSLAGVGVITETDRMTEQIVRAGINYRF